jgi:hypothetical protein
MTAKMHDPHRFNSEHHFTDQSSALQQLLKHAAKTLSPQEQDAWRQQIPRSSTWDDLMPNYWSMH